MSLSSKNLEGLSKIKSLGLITRALIIAKSFLSLSLKSQTLKFELNSK